MRSPTPGPFLGSMPSPDIAGARLARQVDLAVSAAILVAGAGVWIGARLGGQAVDPGALLKASGAAMLLAAVPGFWLMRCAAGWERLGCAVILDAVGRRLWHHRDGKAVRLAPSETPARGIAGLVEALVDHARRLNAPPAGPADLTGTNEAAFREGRAEARQIVSALHDDAETLTEVSGEIETAMHRLAADSSAAETACAAAQSSIDDVVERVAALTRAIGATTEQVKSVTMGAVALSDRAFACQRSVAGLDDRTATLVVAMERIEAAVQRIAAPGVGAASGGEGGAVPATIVSGMRELAAGAGTALKGLQTEVAAMSAQAAEAARTSAEIFETVKAHHELGAALADTVAGQAQEVAGLVQRLAEARSGFVTLRASVDAVTRHGSARLAETEALRGTAGRLASHADAVARVLRDVTGFHATPGAGW